MGESMVTLDFTQDDINKLNDLRFHHPDPMVYRQVIISYANEEFVIFPQPELFSS